MNGPLGGRRASRRRLARPRQQGGFGRPRIRLPQKKLRNRRNNFPVRRLAISGVATDQPVASALMLPSSSCCVPMIATPYSAAIGVHRTLICRRPRRLQMPSIAFCHPLIAE